MIKYDNTERGEIMAVGIIAEYNPFHNGHLYHLKKIKELYKDEEIILVLSGNFTQRGEPSIIDKWRKTEIAKLAGIDLIIELPFLYSTQSADFFSYGALTILEKLKVDQFVFGSETDDIETLTEIAKAQIENENFDHLVQIYSKLGENYPTAISKALYDLTGKKINAPNDLLGVSYIKTILKNHYQIKPVAIKRTTCYHTEKLKKITSSTTIRNTLKEKKEIDIAIPTYVKKYLKQENLHFMDDYFPLLKYKIITEKDLSIYHTVDEGIDRLLKKVVMNCSNYNELILKLKSKRYTYNKISRMLLHILIGLTKEEANQQQNKIHIRILGFNEKGQKYLNRIKKKIDIPILSKFEKNNPLLELELKSTIVYSLPKDNQKLIKKEFQNQLKKEIK